MIRAQILSRISGIAHGFGAMEDPVPLPFQEDWEALRPKCKQVHGTAAAEVLAWGQNCGEVDAVHTRRANIPVAVMTADCVPILLSRTDGSRVAAIHAGWRGTRARILKSLWNELALQGENSLDWVAAIGPAIGPCCYEVSPELAQDFLTEFASFGSSLILSRERNLDLPAINAAQLRELGFADVEVIRACTFCSVQPRFHSYRREGSGVRQWSVIQIRA